MNQIDRYAHFNGKRSTDADRRVAQQSEKTVSWEGACLYWWSVCLPVVSSAKDFPKIPLAIPFQIRVILTFFMAKGFSKIAFAPSTLHSHLKHPLCQYCSFNPKKVTCNSPPTLNTPLWKILCASWASRNNISTKIDNSLSLVSTKYHLLSQFFHTLVWQTFRWEGCGVEG